MTNQKIAFYKEQSDKYDNMFVCAYPDCGHRFTDINDWNDHEKFRHSKKLTGPEWTERFKTELMKDLPQRPLLLTTVLAAANRASEL